MTGKILIELEKILIDEQRGDGVFDSSIEALQMLNKVGFGIAGGSLELDLVYNPSGAFYREIKKHWNWISKKL